MLKHQRVQWVIFVAVIVYFFINSANTEYYAAVYGGLIGLANTALINQHTHKQKQAHNTTPQASVGMMAISVIMRMALVVVLVLIGFVFLELNASILMISLVFGLIGFLMDKVGQK